ncbi:hypothetical protein ABZ477_01245 [Microbacterium sp. NPDC019599]|uniref:hypothetical protein n=1 Tax=Microbacterium sp. NPDC019599 TaxID=3154690 RepID=UPI0033D6BA1B
MRKTTIARIIVITAIAAGALGLTACQTGAQPSVQPISVPQRGPVDQSRIEEYAGRPADRVAEDIERRIREGQLPSSACRRHAVVEHPDGSYHLVCTVPATE